MDFCLLALYTNFYRVRTLFHLRRPIGVLLLVLVMGIWYNAVFNRHAHRLADGRLIWHAHPYCKDNPNSPIQSHPHTESEFFTLDVLSHPVFLAVLFAFACMPRAGVTEKVTFVYWARRFPSRSRYGLSLRSPPPFFA